jgi:hypothetical protein
MHILRADESGRSGNQLTTPAGGEYAYLASVKNSVGRLFVLDLLPPPC